MWIAENENHESEIATGCNTLNTFEGDKAGMVSNRVQCSYTSQSWYGIQDMGATLA